MPSPHPRADVRTARLFVAGQFVLLALLVVLPWRDHWTVPQVVVVATAAASAIGLLVMLVGGASLGRGLTAAPLPNAYARLRTGGLYRFVRHPIYSGLLLFAAALTIASGSWFRVLVFALLVVLINVKARWEERRLAARFPDYEVYAERTPRFIPLARRRSNLG